MNYVGIILCANICNLIINAWLKAKCFVSLEGRGNRKRRLQRFWSNCFSFLGRTRFIIFLYTHIHVQSIYITVWMQCLEWFPSDRRCHWKRCVKTKQNEIIIYNIVSPVLFFAFRKWDSPAAFFRFFRHQAAFSIPFS